MSGKRNNADCVILIIIGLLMSFIYKRASVLPYNDEGVLFGRNYNLIVYLGSLAAAFLLFLILTFIRKQLQKTRLWASFEDPEDPAVSSVGKRILYMFYMAIIVLTVILIYKIYTKENSLYPENNAITFLRHMVPHPVYFLIFAALAFIFYISMKRKSSFTPDTVLRFGLMPVMAFVNASLLYCPNILEDAGAGPLHIHAVTNSIINVMHGAPYSDLNVSIYGHYGLFLGPIARLAGNNLNAVMLSIAISGFIAFLAAFYVAHKLVRDNFVYVLTVLGITGTTTLLTRRGQYFQVNPLRLLFPALTLALVAYAASHTETKKRVPLAVLDVVVGSFAIIWNTETGVFCLLTLMIVHVYRALYTDPLFSRHTIVTALKQIPYAAACGAIAFASVGIYNRLMGGSFGTVRQYIYPFFSGIYHVSHLRVRLPSVTYLYFFEILLFLFTAFIILRRQAQRKGAERVSETTAFATSIMGLFALVYFMNRAVYGNMSISHVEFNLLLGYYGAKALKSRPASRLDMFTSPLRMMKGCMSAILFALSFAMAAEGAMYIQVAADYRARTVWNTSSLAKGAEELKEAIPENTFAFGTYVPELYAALGRDTGCHMIDWSDINETNRNYAVSEAMKQERFVCSVEDLEFPGYKVTKKVNVGPYTFRLYEKEKT